MALSMIVFRKVSLIWKINSQELLITRWTDGNFYTRSLNVDFNRQELGAPNNSSSITLITDLPWISFHCVLSTRLIYSWRKDFHVCIELKINSKKGYLYWFSKSFKWTALRYKDITALFDRWALCSYSIVYSRRRSKAVSFYCSTNPQLTLPRASLKPQPPPSPLVAHTRSQLNNRFYRIVLSEFGFFHYYVPIYTGWARAPMCWL